MTTSHLKMGVEPAPKMSHISNPSQGADTTTAAATMTTTTTTTEV